MQGEANELYTERKLLLIKELRKLKLKSKIRLTIHDGFVGTGPRSEMKQVEELTKNLGKKSVLFDVDFDKKTHWYGEKIAA